MSDDDLQQEGLDPEFDSASEGLGSLVEATAEDLAAEREDRQAAESRTKTAETEEDLSEEKFIYTLENGEEIEGTIAEITEKVAALQVEAKLAEAKAAEKPPEKPAEAKVGEEAPAIEPVNWDVVGENLDTMLQEGRQKEVGPALNDLIHRTIFTSPHIGGMIEQFIDVVIAQREQGAKVQTSFQEFVGEQIPDAEVKAFMQANPWAKDAATAVLGIKTARMAKEVADLKAGKTAEVKAAEVAGKKAGATQTVKDFKAKGLRRASTSSGTGRAATTATTTQKGAQGLEGQALIDHTVAKIRAGRVGRT